MNVPCPNCKGTGRVELRGATSYAWLIWHQPKPGLLADTRHRWIEPCRRQLERPGDYPAYPEQWAKIAPPAGELL